MDFPHGERGRVVSLSNADFFRTRLCDPNFSSCDLFQIASKEYAAEAAANITDVGLSLHSYSLG